jgi:hypothetical protein
MVVSIICDNGDAIEVVPAEYPEGVLRGFEDVSNDGAALLPMIPDAATFDTLRAYHRDPSAALPQTWSMCVAIYCLADALSLDTVFDRLESSLLTILSTSAPPALRTRFGLAHDVTEREENAPLCEPLNVSLAETMTQQERLASALLQKVPAVELIRRTARPWARLVPPASRHFLRNYVSSAAVLMWATARSPVSTSTMCWEVARYGTADCSEWLRRHEYARQHVMDILRIASVAGNVEFVERLFAHVREYDVEEARGYLLKAHAVRGNVEGCREILREANWHVRGQELVLQTAMDTGRTEILDTLREDFFTHDRVIHIFMNVTLRNCPAVRWVYTRHADKIHFIFTLMLSWYNGTALRKIMMGVIMMRSVELCEVFCQSSNINVLNRASFWAHVAAPCPDVYKDLIRALLERDPDRHVNAAAMRYLCDALARGNDWSDIIPVVHARVKLSRAQLCRLVQRVPSYAYLQDALAKRPPKRKRAE